MLEELCDRLPESAAARHAALTLGLPLMRRSRRLELPDGEAPMGPAAGDGGKFIVLEPRPEEARRWFAVALQDEERARRTFGQQWLEEVRGDIVDWERAAGGRPRNAGAASAGGRAEP